jgi:acetolactate synthase-1/2/3 large subunit
VARSADTVGALLAQRLAAAGVRHAFGFPGGGSNLDLIEAFGDAGIEWILTHTETGAAFMAAATAEITGSPGVVAIGNGPGLASVVNGVAHAHLDRVPLIVISDRYTAAEAASTGHQILDQRALLAPVVKYGATLEAADAPATIDAAINAALAPPAGPVHLDMRRDLALEPVTGAPAPPVAVDPPQPEDQAGVPDLAAALDGVERPVILVGLEANRDVDPADLRSLAHALGAAVLTTYKAKGCYPEDDERWAGILTGGAIERPLLERAGALLAIGLDPVELLARPWSYAAPVLSIAASGATDAYLRPMKRVVGDVGARVRELAALVGTAPAPAAGWPGARVTRIRESMLDTLRLEAGPLPGWQIVQTVTDVLPAAATITVDAGAHMFPATCFGRPSGPRRFLISNGLATMGFAVPAAIGAALARPEEVALAFVGDGGMAYHLSELETATRHGARVIVVVLNDSSLSLIRIKQEAKGYTRRPLNFGPTRFDVVAEGLGVRGLRVETPAELEAALGAALAAPTSTVIDVQTTGREYAETLALIRG